MLSNLTESHRFKQFRNSQNWITLLILLLCMGIYVWLSFQGDYNLFTPAGLKAMIQELGVWSALVYMGILALSVVISPIPGAPLVVAGGVIWGFPMAGLYSVVGGLLGGLVAYCIGRTLGDSTLQMLTGKSIQINQNYKDHYVGWLVFFSRLFPVLPFGFISYGAGIAQIPAKSYTLGTLLGMTPPTLLLSYLGESLTTSILRTALIAIVILILFVGVPLALRQSRVSLPLLNLQQVFSIRSACQD